MTYFVRPAIIDLLCTAMEKRDLCQFLFEEFGALSYCIWEYMHGSRLPKKSGNSPTPMIFYSLRPILCIVFAILFSI